MTHFEIRSIRSATFISVEEPHELRDRGPASDAAAMSVLWSGLGKDHNSGQRRLSGHELRRSQKNLSSVK